MNKTMKRVSAKLFACVAVMALAVAMLPAVAFAADTTTGTITITSNPTITSGTSFDLKENCVSVSGTNGDYHLNFKVTQTSPSGSKTMNVNKSSGMAYTSMVASQETATVTVYLIPGGAFQSRDNPDGTPLDTKTISVTISANTSTYGYQGGNVKIKTSTAIASNPTGSQSTGWSNVLSTPLTAGTATNFTFEQTAGLDQYNDYYSSMGSYNNAEEAYQALAGQYISLTYSNGGTPTTVTLADNNAALQIDAVNSSTVTLVITVPSGMTDANLTFASSSSTGLHTFTSTFDEEGEVTGVDINTPNKYVGCNIAFDLI